jgi:glycosyl-4,4'-diaponeurosporenoate acyltransferase
VPIDLPTTWVVALNITGWPVIQFGLAWAFTQLPVTWFKPPAPRAWERGGRFYDCVFGIKRWKDRLPDAARWLHGGFAKGALGGTDRDYLRRFISETWRGELCHWFALACAPIFFLWNPWWANLIMVGYGLLANLPCILAQRYNRARFERFLLRRP